MTSIANWLYATVAAGGGEMGVYGAPFAQAQLSDGSLVMACTDIKNPYVDVIHVSADRTTVTELWRNSYSAGLAGLTQGFDLCVDSSDNIYVLDGVAASSAAIGFMVFKKGAGDTWTNIGLSGSAATPQAVDAHAITSGAAWTLQSCRMVWCNTTGGTGGAGHLLCLFVSCTGTPIPSNAYMILDAGAALAGTMTSYVNGALNATFLSTTTGANILDIAQPSLGATSGVALCQGVGSTSTTLNLGSWAVNSAGALSTNTHIGVITGVGTGSITTPPSTVSFGGTVPYFFTAQVVCLNSPAVTDSPVTYLITYPTSTGGFGTAVYNTSVGLTITTALPTDVNTLAGYNWQLHAGGTAGAIYVDPTVANQVWVVFPQVTSVYSAVDGAVVTSTLAGGALARIRGVVNIATPSVTWDQIATVIDNVTVAGGDNFPVTLPTLWSSTFAALTVKAVANPRSSVVDIITSFAAGVIGTALSQLFGTQVLHAPQPAAPALAAPVNGAVIDISTGPSFSWTPDPANAQAFYAFQRQDGAGAVEWWNGSAFTAVECWVSSGTAALTFGAGLWLNYGTKYTWWVRTMTNLTPSPLPSAFAVTGGAPPSVAVTPTNYSTNTPTISWVVTPGTFDTVQSSWRVIIGASGFAPLVSTAVYDSGVVTGTATSLHVMAPNWLGAEAYDAYVIVTMSDGSTNGTADKASFTVTATPSTAPTLAATFDATYALVQLAVTGTASGTTTAYVQYSDDGGTTWYVLPRYPTGFAFTSSPQTISDYESTPGLLRSYRAFLVVTTAGNQVLSNNSTTQTATVTIANWWLKDPLVPANNCVVNVMPSYASTVPRRQKAYFPLGRPTALVIADVEGQEEGTLPIETFTTTDYAALQTVAQPLRTLLLQSPFGEQWYVWVGTLSKSLELSTAAAPYRKFSLPFVSVVMP